jgi:hypothetical protein
MGNTNQLTQMSLKPFEHVVCGMMWVCVCESSAKKIEKLKYIIEIITDKEEI